MSREDLAVGIQGAVSTRAIIDWHSLLLVKIESLILPKPLKLPPPKVSVPFLEVIQVGVDIAQGH